MSSFLVETSMIDRILTILGYDLKTSDYLRERIKDITEIDCESYAWADKLGTKMLELNYQALHARYGDTIAKVSYRFKPQPVSHIEAIKALQCWLYQCNEGELDQTSLYKLMDDDILKCMMKQFLYSLPEYDKADWG